MAVLEQASRNPSVDVSQFDYKALGRAEGDVLDDFIMQARFKSENGDFEEMKDSDIKSAVQFEGSRSDSRRTA